MPMDSSVSRENNRLKIHNNNAIITIWCSVDRFLHFCTFSPLMDGATRTRIERLAFYLESIPNKLPLAPPESKLNALLNFSLDPEWIEEIGEEACVNREIEAALFEFGPRNDQGIFQIKERGPALEAFPAVLRTWLDKYPKSFFLLKWLQNAIDSAVECFTHLGVAVSPFARQKLQ